MNLPWMSMLLALCAMLAGGAGLLGQQPALSRVEAVGFTVSNMDRSVDFYSHVLHFHKLSDVEHTGSAAEHLKGVFGARLRVVRMKLGDERIELSEYLASRGRPVPADMKSNDVDFQHLAIVVSDMSQAYAWPRQNQAEHMSSGPQTLPAWNLQAAGIQAFYFHDPDDHVLEIIPFPAGKGDPRWQSRTDSLFEGIDHTTIVASDTKKSIAFYRDLLGMKIVGASENYGDEQEHLNQVFGARLRITSLRATHGPGIELLEYPAPHTGRPIPADHSADDIAHWETLTDTDNIQQLWMNLTLHRVGIISSALEKADADKPDARLGFLMKDPDSHVPEALQNSSENSAEAATTPNGEK